MKKAAELRDFLSANVPLLAANPDKLHVFIEKGAVAAKTGRSLSFEYHYTLNLIITDYTEPVDTLTVPIIAWVKVNQNDLIADKERRDKAIRIEAEIIDHKTVDISLSIDLSESVVVTDNPDGGWICEHVPEPELPDLSGPTVWEINPPPPTP